jgi:hypothetical protein
MPGSPLNAQVVASSDRLQPSGEHDFHPLQLMVVVCGEVDDQCVVGRVEGAPPECELDDAVPACLFHLNGLRCARGSCPATVSGVVASRRSPTSILLIGNSYTEANNLRAVLGSLQYKSGIAANVRISALTAGGETMSGHVAKGEDSKIAGYNVVGYNVVVLQEPSQISGFGNVPSWNVTGCPHRRTQAAS